MALPTILFNSSTGSDTAASGAGPGTALFGTGASLNGTTTVTLSADIPDLSGVATDGSACLWVDTTSGRQYSRITAVDNAADTVTVATAYSVTESGRNWGIGGKRATITHADSRTLFADVEAGWIIELQDDGAGAVTTSAITVSSTAAFTIRGDSASTKRLVTQSANAAIFSITGAGQILNIENLIFENTNGTKTSAVAVTCSVSCNIRSRNCRYGHATNKLLSACARTGGTPNFVYVDCEIMYCTGDGISARSMVIALGCSIHHNTSRGITSSTLSNYLIVSCTIWANGSDGVGWSSDATTHGCVCDSVIHGNTGDGLDLSTATTTVASLSAFNNNITGNGGYGINAASGAAAPMILDHNNFGTGGTANTSGSINNLTAGANDLAVDPGYSDSSTGNFAAGTNIKAEGFPDAANNLGARPTNGTKAYLDVGIQRQEAAAGGGGPLIGGRLVRV